MMIVASKRAVGCSVRNKQIHFALSSLVTSSFSAMPPPVSSLCTDNPPPSTDSSSDFTRVFSEGNKARTITLLSTDRDNSAFSFKKYGKDVRKAAVLVPFCYDLQGRPGLICNLRSESLSSHKGEISFPGGTLDPEDENDPVVAALRETHEELGISKDQVTVWTTCRVFPTVSSQLAVIPVVGFINSGPINPDCLEINPSEVDHAFVIPLEHLCDPSNWDEMAPPTRLGGASLTLPIFKNMSIISEGLKGVQLWGLTAFITHLVLSALLPNQYTRQVPYIKLMAEKRKKDDAKERAINQSENPKSKL